MLVKDAIKQLLEFQLETNISIQIWEASDVLYKQPDLTEQQVNNVLNRMDDYDPDWGQIDFAIEEEVDVQ